MLVQKESQSKSSSNSLLNTYNRHNVNFVSGNGSYLYDENRKSYLDFLSGIAVTGFGHNHPKLVTAAVEQTMSLWHVSNLFNSHLQNSLADKLVKTTKLSSVFFCNSGTEANEAAIKFARKWGEGRSTIITTLGGFHGRTMGSLAASAQYKLWEGFFPLTPGFKYVPFNDIEAVENSIDKHTVAVMLEPIQGENGIILPDEDYLQKLKTVCDENNLLLILDEIQTGIGRTGKMFAYQWENIQPDIITSAKGIANGLPLGAVICSERVSKVIKPGMHGSTFGGNPVAVSVANMVMDLLNENLLAEVTEKGEKIIEKIKSLDFTEIVEIRGKGLLIGIEFKAEYDVKNISKELLNKGVVTVTAGNNTLRLLPPLIVSEKEINEFLKVFADTLNNYIPHSISQEQLQTK
ncbi:MAG: aspartate aminotransferase family protein [Bacteroidetes bacterium]|nr:aspartate aminotransferase family protein [Bacteroidota bacterium]